MNNQNRISIWYNISTIRVAASTLGVLVGLAGIEHGFFEMLQGNVSPSSIWIDAIGPEQRIWDYATETAITIVPNFFWTGVMAMIFGLFVTIWAILFIDRKYGARILLLLSIILWLVGGGYAPVIFTIFATITATRINKPLTWWNRRLSLGVQDLLVKLWPGSVFMLVITFWIGVEIAIFGYPLLWFVNADFTYGIQWIFGILSLILMFIVILSAIAFKIRNRSNSLDTTTS
ncbi:MAG: hypothetical protein ACFFFH_18445 [Candidatus Thorarchaeota archaeon]